MPKTYSWKEMWSGLKDIPRVILTEGEKRLVLKPGQALTRIKSKYPGREVQWVVTGGRRAEAFRIDVRETQRHGYRARQRTSILCPFSSKSK